MKEAFSAMLTASFAGSLAIIALCALYPLTKRFFPSMWHYYANVLALFAMFLPVKIEHSGVRRAAVQNIPVLKFAENMGTAEVHAAESHTAFDFFGAAAYIWAAVALSLVVFRIAGYALFIAKMKKGAEKSAIEGGITLYECEREFSPFAAGLIKRAVFMPRLGEEEKKYALKHEMAHIRRGDVYIKWLVAAVKCVSWFNPLVYFAARKADAECEISCDAEVVKTMNSAEKDEYARTILSIAERCVKKRIPLATGMAGEGKILKRRFEMIRNGKKCGLAAKIISTLAAAVIFAAAVCTGGVIAGGGTADGETPGSAGQTGAEFAWPCPESGEISMRFGERVHPITGEKTSHDGIDIKAPEGAKVVSALEGTVSDAGFTAERGNYVEINSGKYTCLYSHLKAASVKMGDGVLKGGEIGEVGNSGKSTGAHLHFEVYDTESAEKIDPEKFYPPVEEATFVVYEPEEASAEDAAQPDLDGALQSLMRTFDLAGHKYEIKNTQYTADGKTVYVEIQPRDSETDSNYYLTVLLTEDGGVMSVKDYYLEK